MPSRSTLPETDPLAQLGIGGAAPAKREPVIAKTSIKPTPTRLAEPEPPQPRLKRRASARSQAEPAADVSVKQKLNCRIPYELADSIRDCVVALSGPPNRLTIDGFAEEAFRRELQRLCLLHRDGQPFQKRPYNPRPGRPVG